MSRLHSSSLGHRLQAARVSAGLTREQLATAIDKSWPTVRAYELGQATPPLSVLYRLADAFGVPVADLLDDEQVSA